MLVNDPFGAPEIIKRMPYDEMEDDTLFTSLQLTPDGKIYVSKTLHGGFGLPNLGVIYNPDRSG